ncbi:MAG: hypothetical protein ACFFCD_11050 [Promethearchaeota archaeon]
MVEFRKVLFTSEHQETLQIELSYYSAFRDLLTVPWLSYFPLELYSSQDNMELTDFDIVVIGHPKKTFSIDQIIEYINYVEDGGCLWIISGNGGDFNWNNNLSELGKQFGIIFQADRVVDHNNNVGKPTWPIITDIIEDQVALGVNKLIYPVGCSLLTRTRKMKNIAFSDDNASVETISRDANKKEFSDKTGFFGKDDWIDIGIPSVPIIASTTVKRGKIVAIGTPNFFHNQVIRSADNHTLILNLFVWMVSEM